MILKERKNVGSKISIFKKIFLKMSKFLTDTLAKSSQNIFVYSFASEHSKHPFFEKETCIFSGVFFYVLPIVAP